MTGIDEKVIAITGAGSGMGEATARLLAAKGHSVVLGDRSDRVADVAAAIQSAGGGDALHACIDVTRPDDLATFVAAAVERHGRLDVLVNNAGVGPISPLDDLRLQEWEAMIDINLKGVLYGIAAALPVFRAQGSGQFVNTASTAAFRIVPNMAVYAATKSAVRVISEGLRQEAGDKLRVTVISPGFTNTAFADDGTNQALSEQVAEAKQRMGMPPLAVAHAIAFAIEQPGDIDVGEIVIRPTAQA